MLTCFKSYDIRGRYPSELDEDLAIKIGKAFADFLRPNKVVVGRDVRLSSPTLSASLIEGLLCSGVQVCDIGLCGTEQVYFATAFLGAEGGIMVTASHNPSDYNGMKLLKAGAAQISGDSGLGEIKEIVSQYIVAGDASKADSKRGRHIHLNPTEAYIGHLLSYININRLRTLKPLKIVVNAGNGGAGLIIDRLQPLLPFDFIKINHQPDGSFPQGVPNPILSENRKQTEEAVLKNGAHLGIAWDGDFDRCFFFDETGRFIEGYYIVGLLAEHMLQRNPGAKIIIDPRLRWNSLEIITGMGGVPIVSKTGHAFIKERMRAEDALYGGEMSAHHYFKEFYYCDSGMIPWLIVAELLFSKGRSMSELVSERMRLYPCSGEINKEVPNPQRVMDSIRDTFQRECLCIDYIDGLSMEFKEWRFNLRSSNTEPLLRLNVESRGNNTLLEEKTSILLELIDSFREG